MVGPKRGPKSGQNGHLGSFLRGPFSVISNKAWFSGLDLKKALKVTLKVLKKGVFGCFGPQNVARPPHGSAASRVGLCGGWVRLCGSLGVCGCGWPRRRVGFLTCSQRRSWERRPQASDVCGAKLP
jgi:hypothetical protein